MRIVHRISLLALLLALTVGPALAESEDIPEPGQLALNVSNSMKANGKNLARYTWKNTLEISEKGAVVSTTVNQVRFDSDGKLEMTLVSQKPEPEKDKKGLRGKKQDKKKEYLHSIVELANAYTNPPTGDLVGFFEKSTFALGAGNMDGYVQVHGKGLVQDGDEVTMWIDKSTSQPHKTEFRTALDGDPVTGTVTYDYVSDEGPFYAAKQVVTVDAKKLEAVIKNSDHAVAE